MMIIQNNVKITNTILQPRSPLIITLYRQAKNPSTNGEVQKIIANIKYFLFFIHYSFDNIVKQGSMTTSAINLGTTK